MTLRVQKRQTFGRLDEFLFQMRTDVRLIDGKTRTGFEQFFEAIEIDELKKRFFFVEGRRGKVTLKYFSSSNSEKTVPRTWPGFSEVQFRFGNLYFVSIFFLIVIEPGGGSSMPGNGGAMPKMGGG